MNSSLVIEICTGTACYVQGGSYLLEIENRIPTRLRSRISIRGVGCLGICGRNNGMRPPYALVDQSLMGDLDLDKLEAVILSIFEEKKHEQ